MRNQSKYFASSSGREGVSIILILIVLLIIGGAGFYFYSDVFKTKVNEAARQATKWTPENIQEDPVGYLTWARSECSTSLTSMKARALSLRTKVNEASRELTARASDEKSFQSLLDEAKGLYRTANEANQWPVSLRGTSLSQEQLKKKIVETYQRIESDSTVATAYQNSINTFNAQLEKINRKTTEIEQLKRKLTTDLEVAKVNVTTKGLEGIAERVNAIMDTSLALADLSKEPSIDDLVTPSKDEKINTQFDQIMDAK